MWHRVIAVLFFTFCVSHAQQLTVLEKVPINATFLLTNKNVLTTEFLTKKKKSVGQFDAVSINDILSPYISQFDEKTKKKLVFIAESADSTQQSFSVADIRPDISPLPALFLIRKTMMLSGDTIRIPTVDSKLYSQALGSIVVRRFYLPLSIANDEILSAFQPMSVVFPLDGKPFRWLKDVCFLYVCRLDR